VRALFRVPNTLELGTFSPNLFPHTERTRMKLLRLLMIALLLIQPLSAAQAAEASRPRVSALKITVLSTMLADEGIGEWGYAALVEVDGKRMLFDTGARPQTVLNNARELNVDLASVEDLVLSHSHDDHTGGLITLRRELMKANPRALSRAHVGAGIFLERSRDGRNWNGLLPYRAEYEQLGGRFLVHDKVDQLVPGVWISGPVPRVNAEKNYPKGIRIKLPSGDAEDTVPEDSSLIIDTKEGLVILSGCGHAGIINTVQYARKAVASAPLLAVVGGLHTFEASDEALAWTAQQLKAAGLRHLLAGHCTGIEATFRIRQLAGLTRKTAAVSAVGSSFTLGKGIDPLVLAQ
jgi:7,8-dihydropterin-6-yl-methyl-4-(beta-D-ribofuranosyl)aminobenzene 5'-phosphate synthase